MLQSLLELDYTLLHLINVEYIHPYLDQFWKTVTFLHKQPWFQLTVVPALAFWAIYIYRAQVWKPLLAAAMAVGIADALAYRVLKQIIVRDRPFLNPDINEWVRKLGEAHGQSFPSNHAANVTAGAIVLAWYFPRARNYFYTFALIVSLSRAALGVHYPSDVMGGALLGIFVGVLVRALLLKSYSLFPYRT